MAEQMLDDEMKNELKERLAEHMKMDVELLYFEQETQYNDVIKQLYTEVAGLSPKIRLTIAKIDSDIAKRNGITFGPVLLIKGGNVKGDVRFYGIPAGYEFSTLIEALLFASDANIASRNMVEFANALNKPLKLEVFVTPTCPYCPTSAFFAFKLAMISEKVKGYVYEASEFPDFVNRYGVSGVPKTVIDDGKGGYEGGMPEDVALLTIKKYL